MPANSEPTITLCAFVTCLDNKGVRVRVGGGGAIYFMRVTVWPTKMAGCREYLTGSWRETTPFF